MSETDDDAPAPESWIAPFFRDSTLWPVTLAVAGTLVTFLAAILLYAVRGRNGFAIAALLLLVGMSADIVWRDLRQRRLRSAALVLAVWSLSALVAVGAVRIGIF